MAQKKVQAKNEAVSNAQKLGLGVGLTAAAVAAAGAYFLYGSKDASKNRKKVKSWSLKAKAEVLEAMENAQQISEEEFKQLVSGVTDTYGKVQKISKVEAAEFKAEMAKNWQDLMKSGMMNVAAAKKVVSKVAPKAAAKKVVKKAAAPAKKVVKEVPTAAKKAVKKAVKKVTK